jgi:hypothetical protein
MPQMTFDQVGTLYNKITNELVGGVTHANQQTLIQQVSTVQNQIQGLINNGSLNSFADPVNGNVTLVHAQNIADQMNFLKGQISNFGTNSFTPKFINDVVRDVQDIVAGDQNLTNLAQQNNHAGFQQVSNLLTPPTPFPDSGAQTNTLLQFISDSNSLASRAQALAGSDPKSAAFKHLSMISIPFQRMRMHILPHKEDFSQRVSIMNSRLTVSKAQPRKNWLLAFKQEVRHL